MANGRWEPGLAVGAALLFCCAIPAAIGGGFLAAVGAVALRLWPAILLRLPLAGWGGGRLVRLVRQRKRPLGSGAGEET